MLNLEVNTDGPRMFEGGEMYFLIFFNQCTPHFNKFTRIFLKKKLYFAPLNFMCLNF